MYVCVFITRFPFKGVLQVNGVRARARQNGFNFGTFRARADPFHTEDPSQWKLCFMYLYVNTHIYIYIYIYIYTHIYIYMYVSGFVQSLPTKIWGIQWWALVWKEPADETTVDERKKAWCTPAMFSTFFFFCFWPNSVWRGQTIKFPPYSDIFGHAGQWRDQEDGSLRCEASSSPVPNHCLVSWKWALRFTNNGRPEASSARSCCRFWSEPKGTRQVNPNSFDQFFFLLLVWLLPLIPFLSEWLLCLWRWWFARGCLQEGGGTP